MAGIIRACGKLVHGLGHTYQEAAPVLDTVAKINGGVIGALWGWEMVESTRRKWEEEGCNAPRNVSYCAAAMVSTAVFGTVGAVSMCAAWRLVLWNTPIFLGMVAADRIDQRHKANATKSREA